MAGSNNKFLVILALSNLLGFVVIFVLLWMLWSNTSTVHEKEPGNRYLPASTSLQTSREITAQPRNTQPFVKATDLSIINAVAKEVRSNNIRSNNRFDLDMPETLNSESIKPATNERADFSSASLSDDEYIANYNQIKRSRNRQRRYTKEDVTTVKITDKINNNTESMADHFNKVDVSHIKNKQTDKLSLAQQVAAIAATSSSEATIGNRISADTKRNRNNSNNDIASEDFTGWQAYLHALKDAETERQNEMRTITVKRGETLWKIATRAYGTGHQYKKIFNANPHLTSPDSITVGETLRVPL